MNNNTIGSKIKYEREKLALTQLELGKMLGVTKQCISGWEVGRTTPDSITLNRMAKIFNVNINVFLEDTDNTISSNTSSSYVNLTETELQIISKLRAMPVSRRKAFELLIGVNENKN